MERFNLLILLCFLVVTIIFLLITVTQKHKRSSRKIALNKEYLVGLNFLLNEQPDKAVDLFIRMLEVDNDTVETHLALGKLFRKRGELDRAIKVHQNLISRPQLETSHKILALLALGLDYLSAGVLDRSEQAFKEVLLLDERSEEALLSLLDIYQQEKEWSLAIEIAQKLSKQSEQNMQVIIAHCYCEIAERRLSEQDEEGALFALNKALSAYKQCARANLMLARMQMACSNYRLAIKYLLRIKAQNTSFSSELIFPLAECYRMIGDEAMLFGYIKECLNESPQASIYNFLIDRLPLMEPEPQILRDELLMQITESPSIQGVNVYIKTALSQQEANTNVVKVISAQLEKIAKKMPDYQCVSCGFLGRTFRWQCPSCRQWETVKSSIG